MLYCRVGVQAPRGLPNTTLLGSMRGTLEPPGAGGKLAPPLASPDSMERGRDTTPSVGGGVQVQAPLWASLMPPQWGRGRVPLHFGQG